MCEHWCSIFFNDFIDYIYFIKSLANSFDSDMSSSLHELNEVELAS